MQIEEDKRRRAENLEKIRQLNAAPKRNRTLYHRMETDYERKARQEEEQRRNAVLEERHHIYKHPNPEVVQLLPCCMDLLRRRLPAREVPALVVQHPGAPQLRPLRQPRRWPGAKSSFSICTQRQRQVL